MNILETLANYQDIVKEINHPLSIVCFATENGRRIISHIEGEGIKCNPINKNLRIVKPNSTYFYASPLDLLLSYIMDTTEDAVAITDIIIFDDASVAFTWLVSE